VDAIFKALADPSRRELLSLLRRHGRLNLTALAQRFELSLPTVSSHMRILTDAGLVTREKVARDVFFTINTSIGEDLLGALFTMLAPPGERPAKAGKGVRDAKPRRTDR
jgi:DNA-binding transcriptional ArsR family regulator